jgi:alkylated DNA nucleotide flippase Atl1
MIASMIDGKVKDLEELYGNLGRAREMPHLLDDATVDRAIKLHETVREDGRIFEEQLARWRKEDLTEGQRLEIERLAGQMVKYNEMCEKILALAKELKKGTIDSIFSMSDAELAIAVLTGKIKMPKF